jgi:hypothetical protein
VSITLLNLKRPEKEYLAWKKAVNTIYDPTQDTTLGDHSRIFNTLETSYGCKTIKVHRNELNWLTSIDIEFLSEEHRTWFLLKWL